MPHPQKEQKIESYKSQPKFTGEIGRTRVHVYLEDKNGFDTASGAFVGRTQFLSLDPKEWETMKGDLGEWNVEVIQTPEQALKAAREIRDQKAEELKARKAEQSKIDEAAMIEAAKNAARIRLLAEEEVRAELEAQKKPSARGRKAKED